MLSIPRRLESLCPDPIRDGHPAPPGRVVAVGASDIGAGEGEPFEHGLMMMPLTKPPPLMTTFFHAYGPGVVVSSNGMPASPEYSAGRWQFAGPGRPGPPSARPAGCLRRIERCLRCIRGVASIDTCHATAESTATATAIAHPGNEPRPLHRSYPQHCW